MILHYTYL